ncbi:hypothetical protein [Phenylobacterium sp.]|jgi:hypothetical protein|uniref:hypothetical protein n=1 Tax=Phenylobacterium sp. TaxID=1871053 RepID=UPI002F3F764C
MSAVYRFDELFPDEAEPGPAEVAVDGETTLTYRLKSKLSELKAAGYQIRWIEASEKELVTLFVEGGDDAIQLDPDPDCDRAWYGDFEIRASQKDLIWVYLEGEHEGLSAHIVS